MPVHETPRTIEELKAWYAAHHLPPEDVTRFFIGKDVREPRAFGIYRDGDCFVTLWAPAHRFPLLQGQHILLRFDG